MTSLPQNYVLNDGTLMEGFESAASWTFAGTGSATNNTSAQFVKNGTTSLRIQGTTSGAAVVHKAVTLNLTFGTMVGLWVYDNGAAGTLQSIELNFATDSTNNHRYSYTWSSANISLVRGWNFLNVNCAAFTKTGTPTWATTDYVRIQVNSTGIGGCDVYLDSLYRTFYTRPKVLIYFDDNHDSTYSIGYSYMQDRGLRGTFAFQSNNIDIANAMTTGQMDTAYAANWDVVNHTHTHANLTSISSAQRATELGLCRDIMQAKGWTRTLSYLVAPQGGIDNAVETDIRALGYTVARGGRTVFTNSQQGVFQGLDNSSRLISKDIGNSGVSLAAAKTVVDDCIRLGTSCMLVFHKLGAVADSLTWVTADYQALIDYIYRYAAGNVLDNMTMRDWYSGLTSIRRTR
jgi:peptidoglycan/xylan/chitin deacetylase (PgdA/CDA1 family)